MNLYFRVFQETIPVCNWQGYLRTPPLSGSLANSAAVLLQTNEVHRTTQITTRRSIKASGEKS